MCGFANKFLQDVDEAEEIVQNSFVKFWENKNELKVNSSVRSYMFTSIKNACLNQIKHLKVKEDYKIHNEKEIELSQYSLDDDIDASELESKISKTISELPDARRQIFILSRYEGLKYREIADKLKISIKTVENQMGSAIKFLKSELAEYLVTLLILLNMLTK